MAIDDLNALLEEYGERFLILDFNHLFIASTLREEVWLLSGQENQALIDTIIKEADEFQMQGVSADREIETYSGGEKAILACLLLMAVIEHRGIQGINLLLYNLFEAISEENRKVLLQRFRHIHLHQQIRFFYNQQDQIVELRLQG